MREPAAASHPGHRMPAVRDITPAATAGTARSRTLMLPHRPAFADA